MESLTNRVSVESQSSSETARVAVISRSSVTRAATETASAVEKSVTEIGSARFARTATLLRETSADGATPTRMEHPGRRRCLKLVRAIGIARCVTTTTLRGERSASGAMQTKTEHLELPVAVKVDSNGVVDEEGSVVDPEVVQGAEDHLDQVAVEDRGVEAVERQEEVQGDVVDSTNHSAMRPKAKRSRSTKSSFASSLRSRN
jgi:hypothetical protein